MAAISLVTARIPSLVATAGLLVALLACFRSAPRPNERAQSSPQATEVKPAPADAERARLLTIGKKIFVERCASCHNERGDKPLPTGLPLNERKLTGEKIERGAGSRLRGKTGEEKLAVALYIENFLKK